MRKPFTDDGPNQPLSLIIDCDDPFANRDSIGEGYNSGAGFELCVNNKTWHQPGVQSANVPDRRPDLIRLCCGCNLFSYSSHTPSHSDAAGRSGAGSRDRRAQRLWITAKIFPSVSLNHAALAPPPVAMPFSSVPGWSYFSNFTPRFVNSETSRSMSSTCQNA